MKSFMSVVRNLLFILVAVFSAGTLIVIANGISTGTELSPFNIAVDTVMMHLRTPFLTSLMLFFTNAGSPLVLSVLAVFLALLLFLKRDTYDALLYVASMGVSIVAFTVLKNTFHIARPVGSIVVLLSWSFPSGHATVAAAFFFATSYTFFGKVDSAWKKTLLICGSILGVCLISFSRVYLGVHFALDVLAGIALGILSVSLTVLAFNLFLEEEKWRHKKLFSRIGRLNR
ncbi:MAG: phosphoesterase PA-phosphatase related protein [Parcubacteria group bacterium]|nr:phosphoesterase PA-phosphatase related protein [Parcubacteria group bacterium]